jgi:flagellum-specific ATP synthase
MLLALVQRHLGPALAVVNSDNMSATCRNKRQLAASAIRVRSVRGRGRRLRAKSVLLVMDSVTRYAMDLREAALAAGKPPATKGYPPRR